MKPPRISAAFLAGSMALLGLTTTPAAQAATPAPTSMTMVSWNICGEAGGGRGDAGFCPSRATLQENEAKVLEIVRLMGDQRADAIVLQEVCGAPPGVPATVDGTAQVKGYHQKRLKELFGPQGWSFGFAPVRRWDDTSANSLAYGSPCRGVLQGGRLGNLIAIKGTISARLPGRTVRGDPGPGPPHPARAVRLGDGPVDCRVQHTHHPRLRGFTDRAADRERQELRGRVHRPARPRAGRLGR
ncbi:endonuclease/exonuclease/phosphatase family protein [Streptomyces sp. NPDC056400]|uniref:endonuclease/exonuclease/phosphatase family protein n=1 Tax=Streptomyces sp. NPDC056400 TaxID=3345808 RepID=UPI0035D8A772